jgi:hypothetical protein
MTMIGELMGQVKPPTVSREGIEKAGLRVVRGEEMERMGEEGVVLNSCVERCLVSLFSSIVFVGGFQWLMDAGCRSVWVIMKMERNVGCWIVNMGIIRNVLISGWVRVGIVVLLVGLRVSQ